VAEEKGNRVMELLVNAATPFQLMVGKIAGIGTAGLTQMACLVVVGMGALPLQTPLQAALLGTNEHGFIKYLTGVSIPFYLFFLVYFLLSFSCMRACMLGWVPSSGGQKRCKVLS
jgi:ABC-2 type transport system permease protein